MAGLHLWQLLAPAFLMMFITPCEGSTGRLYGRIANPGGHLAHVAGFEKLQLVPDIPLDLLFPWDQDSSCSGGERWPQETHRAATA